MNKYLLTIEFRYCDISQYDENMSQHVSKTITLGVFNTRDEANLIGNKALEVLESKFKLNPNYNRKERFSNNGGCFGHPKDLITNLGYLKTPFEFYCKIAKLTYDDLEETILNAVEGTKRYREYENQRTL